MMGKLIDERVLWAHALAEASATYDPTDPTEIVVRRRNGTEWFRLGVPPGAIGDPDRTIGVMIEGRGWLQATPARRLE